MAMLLAATLGVDNEHTCITYLSTPGHVAVHSHCRGLSYVLTICPTSATRLECHSMTPQPPWFSLLSSDHQPLPQAHSLCITAQFLQRHDADGVRR